MGHLQRLVQRATASAAVIRPRFDPWSPMSASSDSSELPAEPSNSAEAAAPSATEHVDPRGTGADRRIAAPGQPNAPSTASTVHLGVPPAPKAAARPESVSPAAGASGNGEPARRPVVEAAMAATHVGPARRESTDEADPSGSSREKRVRDEVRVTASVPRLVRREPEAIRPEPNLRKPLAIPFVPDRRESRVEREPDVIISIGRIEVRAPASEERPSRPSRAAKSADVERLEQYVQNRLKGRTA